MELDRIEILIEKYFEGETSIAEEKELKDYFSSSNVAQHLEQYSAVFGYYKQAKKEQLKATIPLKSNKQSIVVWLSVAASVVVMLGVGFTFYKNNLNTEIQNVGKVDDPEIAFRETQKALDLVSKHLNKGIESVSYLNEFEQSKNKVFKIN